MNPQDIDPTELQASPELDAWIATEWMGWEWLPPYEIQIGGGPKREYPRCGAWKRGEGTRDWISVRYWSPSTTAAHAGEARRKAGEWLLDTLAEGERLVGIQCVIRGGYSGECMFREVTGDTDEEIRAKAEALATSRAIAAAIKGKEE